jgi:hypothetical protein
LFSKRRSAFQQLEPKERSTLTLVFKKIAASAATIPYIVGPMNDDVLPATAKNP